MSDTAPLSIVRLLEELHQVSDWYMLGVYLELPSHELDKIRQQFLSEGVERCKAALFNLWLKSNPKASWELIAVALEKSGEKVSAKQIRVRYLPPPSLPAVVAYRSRGQIEQSSVTVEVDQAVVDRFTDLEDNFAILVTNIKSALEEKQIPLKCLQRFLEERLEQSGEYMQTTSIDELFQQMRPHYCFLNITLLKSIVSKFIGEPLQQQLKDYKNQLDEFTTSTKIILLTKDPLMKRIQSQCPPNTKRMPQVVLKLAGCCLNVTIEHFQRLVNKIFRAEDEALTHVRVKDGCICISWLTSESAIPSLVALAQQKVEFMRHVGVLRLTVGEVTILEQTIKEEDDLALALMRAESAGCTEAVEFLLGVDPNYRDKNGCTLLITASKKGYEKNVKVLLEVNADPNLTDIHGQTPLMGACSGGHELIVNLLLQSGADPNIQTSSGMTALICANSKDRHLGIFVSLLAAGAAINAQDSNEWSALMLACYNRCSQIVKLLLDYQADMHLSKSNGATALMIACFRGYEEIVELLLLASDAGVNAQRTDYKDTALILACEKRYERIAALLLQSHADPNLQDYEGDTALILASHWQLTPTIELLLNHGANPNLQNRSGWTALIASCTTKVSPDPDPSIPLLLLSAGADPNAQKGDGLTALMVAAHHGYESGVRVLLNSQADVDTQDIKGNTALHHSASAGHLTITKFLLSAGADSTVVNQSGDTAVDIALAYHHPEVCQLLLMHTETKPHPRDTRPPSTIPFLFPLQLAGTSRNNPTSQQEQRNSQSNQQEEKSMKSMKRKTKI